MYQNKYFKLLWAVLLSLGVVFLLSYMPYIYEPVFRIIGVFLLPILMGGFFYYMLRPLVCFFGRWSSFKILNIILAFFIVVLIVGLISYFGGNIIYKETVNIVQKITSNYNFSQSNINNFLMKYDQFSFLDQIDIKSKLLSILQQFGVAVTRYDFGMMFSNLTDIAVGVLLTPFCMFYFLKDDDKIYGFLEELLSKYLDRSKAKNILKDIDKILSKYISSQIIVAFCLGVCILIGYLIIGMPNSFALALIAMLTSIVPIIGAIIGFIPAFLVALGVDMVLTLKLLLVLFIAQQLEGQLITPFVQGESLEIHPLIVLFVVMAFILIMGPFGALFAVPVYAIIRLIYKKYL